MQFTHVKMEADLRGLNKFIMSHLTEYQTLLFLFALRDICPNLASVITVILHAKKNQTLDVVLRIHHVRTVASLNGEVIYHAHRMDKDMIQNIYDSSASIEETAYYDAEHGYVWLIADDAYFGAVAKLRKYHIDVFTSLAEYFSDPRKDVDPRILFDSFPGSPP